MFVDDSSEDEVSSWLENKLHKSQPVPYSSSINTF